MPSAHRMSSADAAWLHMDRPTNLMVITSAMWFDEPLDWDAVREIVAARLVERFPTFRRRLKESRAPMRAPSWEDDPNFDLDVHLHRLALRPPGDVGALQELVGDLMAQPLDRSRALWDWYLIDGYGEGSAIVARMHHCIADGVALARVLLSLTDSGPDAQIEPEEPEAAGGGGVGGVLGDVLGAPARVTAAGFGLGKAAAHEAIEVVRHPSELTDIAAAAQDDIRAIGKSLLSGPDAKTALKGDLAIGERVAWSQPMPLEDVKAVGHATGTTVNDVLVTAIAGALRSYLAARDSLVDEMHAFVPFNLRPLDQPLPRRLGNRFGLVLLAVPVGIENARRRLQVVHDRMAEIKRSPEGAVGYGLLEALGTTPSEVEQRLLDFFSAAGSAVITNVPGPAERVYFAGTPVRGVLVWAPAAGSVAMSFSIFSYAGEVTVGVMSDRNLVPEPGEIVEVLSKEVAVLLAESP